MKPWSELFIFTVFYRSIGLKGTQTLDLFALGTLCGTN